MRSFFQQKDHPLNLAVLRVVVFGLVLHAASRVDVLALARVPAALRVPPPGYGAWLHLLPWDAAWAQAIRRLCVASALMATVGLWTRASACLACLSGAYVLGLPHLFGGIDHTTHHLIWFAAVLAASPCGDALSVDALARALRRGEAHHGLAGRPAVAYALPLRFVWMLMGVLYLFPGLAKLSAGPEWFLSENIKYTLYEHWQRKQFVPAFRVDLHPALYRLMGLATVLFELSFGLLIWFRRLRPWAIAAGVLFHLLTGYFLHIYFYGLLLCYVAFVDWHALVRRLAARVSPSRTGAPAAVTAPPRRRAAGTVIVGSLLVGVNLYCGLAGIDSWPFAVYPRFDRVLRAPEWRALEIVVGRESGAEVPVRTRLPWKALERIARMEDGAERRRRLRALRDLAVQDGLQLRAGDVVRFYAVTRSTLPGREREPPLVRRLLLEASAESR